MNYFTQTCISMFRS